MPIPPLLLTARPPLRPGSVANTSSHASFRHGSGARLRSLMLANHARASVTQSRRK